MKILYIGSVVFSECALRKLISLGADIVGVITKKESLFNADFSDLGYLAQSHGIPVMHTKDINSPQSENWIRSHSPDLVMCFGWSNLIKNNILNIAPLGVLGFHPSLLPYNRGRHPLIWALALGLEETGSTFFFMDEGADTGDILSQEKIAIKKQDDAASLYSKITDQALLQITDFYPKLESGSFTRRPQPKDVGNKWRKRGEIDGKIDFRMSSTAIYNLVRSLTKPYLGAHVEYRGEQVKIWKIEELRTEVNRNLEPGLVLDVSHDGAIAVKTQDGVVSLLVHEFKNPVIKGEYL